MVTEGEFPELCIFDGTFFYLFDGEGERS